MPPRFDNDHLEFAMIIRKCHKPIHTVVLCCTVASVFDASTDNGWPLIQDFAVLAPSVEALITLITEKDFKGKPPLVGFNKETDEVWQNLMEKHRLKQQHSSNICGVASTESLDVNGNKTNVVKSNSVSDIGRVMLKFRKLEKEEIESRKDDVYSKTYVPKKYSKYSAEYGTPKPGTLTEMRAKKASQHIAKEMLYLCEVIRENGYLTRKGRIEITFGKLFSVYQYISDKVVGILLRARKHRMVDFLGEMLYQRRDEDVIITLLLSNEELEFAINETKK